MPRFKIAIDPGHGGRDPGAIGPSGLYEKDVVLATAKLLHRELLHVLEPYLTRTDDTYVSPEERCERANILQASLFISIHANASDNLQANGAETYALAPGGEGVKVARAVQEALVKATGLRDRGVRFARFQVLRDTAMPAILVEIAFITNPEEEALLTDPAQQTKFARAVAQGVCNYLGVYLPSPEQPPEAKPPPEDSGNQAGNEKEERGEGMSIFKDVNPKSVHVKAVEEVAKHGLMMGTAPGEFEPSRPPTREELASVIWRLYKATNEDFIEVIDKVLPCVVQVENTEQGGLGSGTVIHSDGYVLTNCHVVSREWISNDRGDVSFEVARRVGFRSATEPWKYAEGPVVAYDREADLALCKIELSGPFPVLTMAGGVNDIQISQKVLAVGSPLGLIQSVSEGVVSAVRVNPLGVKGTFIQTEAEINPGNSGGALVNLQGWLIGVPSMKLNDAEGLGFAIAMPTVWEFLKSAKEGLF